MFTIFIRSSAFSSVSSHDLTKVFSSVNLLDSANCFLSTSFFGC